MSEKIVQLSEEVIKGQLKKGVIVKGNQKEKRGYVFEEGKNYSSVWQRQNGYRPW